MEQVRRVIDALRKARCYVFQARIIDLNRAAGKELHVLAGIPLAIKVKPHHP